VFAPTPFEEFAELAVAQAARSQRPSTTIYSATGPMTVADALISSLTSGSSKTPGMYEYRLQVLSLLRELLEATQKTPVRRAEELFLLSRGLYQALGRLSKLRSEEMTIAALQIEQLCASDLEATLPTPEPVLLSGGPPSADAVRVYLPEVTLSGYIQVAPGLDEDAVRVHALAAQQDLVARIMPEAERQRYSLVQHVSEANAYSLQLQPFRIKVEAHFLRKRDVVERSYETPDYTTIGEIVRELCQSVPAAAGYSPDDCALFHDDVELLQPSHTLGSQPTLAGATLALKPRPRQFRINFADATFAFVNLVQGVGVKTLVQLIAQSISMDSKTATNYGLKVEEKQVDAAEEDPAARPTSPTQPNGFWLDDEKVVQIFEDAEAVTLYFLMQPRSIRLTSDLTTPPVASMETDVFFSHTVKQIILELIDQFELDVDDKQLVLTKAGGTPLVQWVALRNQNILPGDELSLMKADKKMLEEAEAGHRVNIWKEEESPSTIVLATDPSAASVRAAKGIEKFIEAATLNKLVEYLTSTTAHDVVFMNAFMYTHGTFATSEWVFRKLVERFDVPDSVPEQNRMIIRMRVCLAMKRLVELYLDDSEDDVHLLDKVTAFAKDEVEKDPQCASISSVIQAAVSDSRKAIASWKAMAAKLDAVEPDEAGTVAAKPMGKLGKTMGLNMLQELDEATIAQHLAAMDYETFCKIVPREFFNFAWTKKRRALAPNIRQLIDQFNYVSTWVASSIVQARDLKSRVEVVEKLVRIMRHLKELQDFSGLMAFSAAFNNSAVLRLKHTKGKLSKKANAAFEEFDKVLSMEGSYKAYRAALKACTPPCTPYIGVFLMDITFIEEGNQNVTEGGLINFAKRQMLYDVISELEGYMGGSYAGTFEKNPMFDILYKNVPQLDEKTMYAMSLKLEPRGAELRDIA